MAQQKQELSIEAQEDLIVDLIFAAFKKSIAKRKEDSKIMISSNKNESVNNN